MNGKGLSFAIRVGFDGTRPGPSARLNFLGRLHVRLHSRDLPSISRKLRSSARLGRDKYLTDDFLLNTILCLHRDSASEKHLVFPLDSLFRLPQHYLKRLDH